MDPHSAKMVRDAIYELKQANCSIILCTHNLAEAEILADKIAIIRKGEIIIQGTSDELKRRLLGVPHYNVQFNQASSDGLPETITNLVTVVEQDERSFTYLTEEAEQVNHRLLQMLAETGRQVLTLSEVPRSLESVYLKIAGQPQDNRDEIEQSLLKQEHPAKKPDGIAADAFDATEELDLTTKEKGALK
jgi:ABC-2 type transport system ATP-binding protein